MKKRSVLMVHGSPMARETLRKQLDRDTNFDYAFSEASSVADSVAACRDSQPDCILFDMNLPDGTGFDLLSALGKSCGVLSASTVAMTDTSDGEACAGSGGWEQGWIIIIDPLVPDTVLQYQQGLPDRYRVTQAGGTVEVKFQPIGIGATATSFTVCRDDPDGSQERIVTISATGSARVTTTTAGTCS